MKNNPVYLFMSALLIMTLISCTDDFYGIEYELIAPTNLNVSYGENVEFVFEVRDNIGISQLKITQAQLGIFIEEIYNAPIEELTYYFSSKIPDSLVNPEISITVDIIDTDNNQLSESIKLSIRD